MAAHAASRDGVWWRAAVGVRHLRHAGRVADGAAVPQCRPRRDLYEPNELDGSLRPAPTSTSWCRDGGLRPVAASDVSADPVAVSAGRAVRYGGHRGRPRSGNGSWPAGPTTAWSRNASSGCRRRTGSMGVKILSEHLVGSRVYCQNCGNTKNLQYSNNNPSADFFCGVCHEDYQLKSQRSSSVPRGSERSSDDPTPQREHDPQSFSPELRLQESDHNRPADWTRSTSLPRRSSKRGSRCRRQRSKRAG